MSDRVDRAHARRHRADQRQRARELIRRGVGAVGQAIGLRAEVGAQVLAAPGEAFEPAAAADIALEAEQSPRGLGGDGEDARRAVGEAVLGFTNREFGAELLHAGAAEALGQHDRVRRRGHDRFEIGVGRARRRAG